MGKKRTFIGKVLYAVGVVKDAKTQDSYESQTEAWQREAECGCGIHCCDKQLVLTDDTTLAYMGLYWSNGALKAINRATGDTYTITITAD